MEDIVTVLLAIFCVLGLTWVVRLVNWIWWKPMKLGEKLKEQGFRGPPYRLLYGCLKENSRLLEETWSKPMNLNHQIVQRLDPYLHKIVKEYGKTSMMWVGPVPRLIIMDPELIKEILPSKFGHFEKPKQHPITEYLVTGLATYEGDKWAKHRRLVSPAFHLEKLKRMLPAFSTTCSELVERWEMFIGSKESCELDVWPEFQNLTADVISRTAFGSSYVEGKHIFQLQSEQASLISKAIRSIYIPENNRRKKIQKDVRDLLRGIIEKRVKAMKIGEAPNDDLLGLLLESNNIQEHRMNCKDIRLTIDEIIEECKLFYLAGHETTSILLTWTVLGLSMNPSWQERAREEVSQVLGKNAPEFDSLNRLKIVSMILYETLRLYSGGNLVRQTCKRMELGKFTLPPGVQLVLPMLLIQHDRELWGDDADEFNPERFSGGFSNALKHQMAFFPFGGGPRICIGMNFALIEAKVALAMILQHFSFELSPSYIHAPITVLGCHPKHGAQIILRKL